MAWTSPMTFVANNVLTAAQMNTHLRDNLLELAPAKASTNAGSIFVTQGPNRLEERVLKTATVATSQSILAKGNDGYVNLPTPGPSVTCEIGSRAIVMLSSSISNNANNNGSFVSFAVSGETEREASDKYSIQTEGRNLNNASQYGIAFFINDLNSGQNTFTMKYKVGKDTSTFANRTIIVIPL